MRVSMLGVGALVSVVLLAGCGGSSGSRPPAARADGASTLASSAASNPASTTTPSPLAFARCMRASGVPNFPDPTAGQGPVFNTTGVNGGAPAVSKALAKCKKFLPSGGLPGPGSTTHPSPQTLAKLLRIARCMRQHGISQFPDPTTTVPSSPSAAGIREVTDFDGAILLFPSTIDMQAPAYKQALTACGAPPLGLPH
jgi:hypothetical protein